MIGTTLPVVALQRMRPERAIDIGGKVARRTAVYQDEERWEKSAIETYSRKKRISIKGTRRIFKDRDKEWDSDGEDNNADDARHGGQEDEVG